MKLTKLFYFYHIISDTTGKLCYTCVYLSSDFVSIKILQFLLCTKINDVNTCGVIFLKIINATQI